MMFNQITSPLVGGDAIARSGEDKIVLIILVGPQGAALGAEGAGAASDRLRPLRHGELSGASGNFP